ncbi:ABC transporter ATP-binding protein [Actomonas aquatica]|uniref:ABC transporter ATP-binding protein n=1 Tax=Actomonas aquatica TaxID=2866162 RepID=A0ABZ1CC81_9BACT|nr:ABC transporter ATP-binding protein [Opitutus sp. WL0086]WRQ89042.1 ABC transporter ATP-binding protein [Opitutus sp. WL0086]
MSLLKISQLTKSYATPEGSRQTVVDVPQFDLAAGEQVAVRGRSGTGKTTFLHLIAGILEPDSGSIHVGETEVTALSESGRDRWRAAHLGYIFQTFNLLQGFTAFENVLLGTAFGGRRPFPEKATAMLERVDLAARRDYRPRQLSTGQQQRVAIARALVNRPPLVLADEPTGNLDPHHAAEALGLIRSVCSETGSALLLVSHDEAVLNAFPRIVDFATLNQAGTPASEVR